MTLCNVKAKFCAFYKRKLKDKQSTQELALQDGGEFKGNCCNCGK